MSRQKTKWQTLKAGDIVDVIAPGSGCSPQELKGGLELIRSWGLRPRVAPHILGKEVLFSNKDHIRLQGLIQALRAKDSPLIWCLRGGYGSLRLLPQLSQLQKPPRQKVILGYSDITTLQTFVYSYWSWRALHGPLLASYGAKLTLDQQKEAQELKKLLFGQKKEMVFKGLKPLNRVAQKSQTLKGPVLGGNLCVLNSSLGTPWQVVPRGSIVFFEDTGEKPHRVDRMLTQMKQAGVFKGVKAIVFGQMLFPDPFFEKLIWKDTIARFAGEMSIPVLKGLPVGHGSTQRPLPVGTQAQLILNPRKAELVVGWT